jgi:hypothetical protein
VPVVILIEYTQVTQLISHGQILMVQPAFTAPVVHASVMNCRTVAEVREWLWDLEARLLTPCGLLDGEDVEAMQVTHVFWSADPYVYHPLLLRHMRCTHFPGACNPQIWQSTLHIRRCI